MMNIALDEILQISIEGICDIIVLGDVNSTDIDQIHIDPPPGGFLQFREDHNVD